MATSSLTVQIDPPMLDQLKENGYGLAIAKMVNSKYTVIWQGSAELLAEDQFEWERKYQVFGENKFQNGALVSATTTIEPIVGGQEVKMDKEGVLGTATGEETPGTAFKFSVDGAYNSGSGLIHASVNALINGKSQPIFVSPSGVIPGGEQSLLPVEKIKVWFGLQIKVRSMISSITGPQIELDFTTNKSQSIVYKNYAWSTVADSTLLSSNFMLGSSPVTDGLLFIATAVGTGFLAEQGKRLAQYVNKWLFDAGRPAKKVNPEEVLNATNSQQQGLTEEVVIQIYFSAQQAFHLAARGEDAKYRELILESLAESQGKFPDIKFYKCSNVVPVENI